jgi:hypothetical protein
MSNRVIEVLDRTKMGQMLRIKFAIVCYGKFDLTQYNCGPS